ncbi:hypothetical protein HanRHA438_Chr02g0046901 [Helianthus annuus]|nr:hypothetical protein HanRHA438_Chr02g0046901 [Helianthus annuus]
MSFGEIECIDFRLFSDIFRLSRLSSRSEFQVCLKVSVECCD